MKRTLIVAMLIALGRPMSAAGPIESTARREAEKAAAAATATTANDGGSTALIWSGVGMMAGGATLEILANTAMKVQEGACVVTYYSYSCASETHTNKPLLFVGLGVAVGGAVLWDLGWRKKNNATLQFGPNSVRLTQTLRF